MQWLWGVLVKITRVPHCDRNEKYHAGSYWMEKFSEMSCPGGGAPALISHPQFSACRVDSQTDAPWLPPNCSLSLTYETLRSDLVIPKLVKGWTESVVLPLVRKVKLWSCETFQIMVQEVRSPYPWPRSPGMGRNG